MATKKRAQKPAEAAGAPSKPEMDPSAPESLTPGVTVRKARLAYSVETLIEEVMDLFPETTYEPSDMNVWGARDGVTFVTDGIDGLGDLLRLLASDTRVKEITSDSTEGLVDVQMHGSLRTMDSREPFGLSEIWGVLCEQYEGGA